MPISGIISLRGLRSQRYGITEAVLVQVDLKTPSKPPAFAFIEFDDPRDAYDAVRGRDGYDYYGGRLRVRLVALSCRFWLSLPNADLT